MSVSYSAMPRSLPVPSAVVSRRGEEMSTSSDLRKPGLPPPAGRHAVRVAKRNRQNSMGRAGVTGLEQSDLVVQNDARYQLRHTPVYGADRSEGSTTHTSGPAIPT